MRLDVVYSSAADCCYTRTTSYLYAFVIDEPLLRLRAPAVDLSQPAPAAVLTSPRLQQGVSSPPLSRSARGPPTDAREDADARRGTAGRLARLALSLRAAGAAAAGDAALAAGGAARAGGGGGGAAAGAQSALGPRADESGAGGAGASAAVWETLVRRSAWAAERKEEERKLVLLQAGAVRARGVMQLACE